ncbi:MAG: nickel pincer cofactor biosynthesis protein LarC [Candidatus Latescibacteria bacterium]|nr:nickel pincer cofactor biosynthesis protein LarC [Candidatus Latescibacterota bacterium]
MRIAYFDCFSGISGDMTLGAIVDAGLPYERLRDELEQISLRGEFELVCRRVKRHGIAGTKVDVVLQDGGGHHHRHLDDILTIIERSGLSSTAKEKTGRIFHRLAEAEAHVHHTTPDEVHFHEVGAVDAIVDVVGAVVGLELLGVTHVYSSILRLGTGFVDCAHGRLPVPVPGVVELCRGIPVEQGDVQAELVTPTGAAIITTLARGFGRPPLFRLEDVGYGAGSRDLPQIPNLLRIEVGELIDEVEEDTSVVIETNIDDMTPEVYGYIVERLFAEGAKDVYLTQVMMKKGRPGVLISVLADPGSTHRLSEILLNETTTLGVRIQEVQRIKMRREAKVVKTPLGDVRVKVGEMHGRRRVTPEFEDCARVAKECGVPILDVYRIVERAIDAQEK